MYLLFLLKIILCITLLPSDKAQAVAAENGPTVKLTPVTDDVTDVVVAPAKTTVSTDSNFDVSVLKFQYFFFGF